MDDTSIPDLSPEAARRAREGLRKRRWEQANPETYRRQRQRSYARAGERKRLLLFMLIVLYPEVMAAIAAQRKERKREADRLWEQRNRAHRNAQHRRRYVEKHDEIRDKSNSQARRRRATNPEPRRQWERTWRRNHRALVNEYKRIYYHAKRRKGLLRTLTTRQWRALLRAVGYRCAYCGEKFAAKDLTIDHIIPLSKGGTHTLDNVIPACRPCNCRKSDRQAPCPVQPFFLLDEGAAD